MKIIKNGKLFGVLNLLDISIITFILLLIIPALHYYIKFNEKGFIEQKVLERYLQQQESTGFQFHSENRGTLEIKVSFKNLTEENLKKIKTGDKEILPDGTVLAGILWLGEPEPNYHIIRNFPNDQNGNKRIILDSGLYSLPAKLKLNGFVHESVFYYKAQAVVALFPIPFATDEYKAIFVIEYGLDKEAK